MKLLLCCTKDRPYLYRQNDDCFEVLNKIKYEDISDYEKYYGLNNGKVIGECDFEVEKIIYRETDKNSYSFGTETLTPDELLDKSRFTTLELCKCIGRNSNWIKGDYGYAIHLKNLKVYDTPRELSDFAHYIDKEHTSVITKAPQNMMYAYEIDGCFLKRNILISIHSDSLCQILNGEKTSVVTKKVLKEMIK